MPLEPPSWWYQGRIPIAAWGLLPLSKVYGELVERRFHKAAPYRSKLPVLCVGNFTMGGAGKTPVALKLANSLIAIGHSPAFLSRGYGGRMRGPYIVGGEDDAGLVGDEPCLLARAAATVISRDRPAGARTIETLAVDTIIMDDGFQNPSLEKNFSLVVVDGGAGVGSARVFPLGPLRAPLAFQVAKADAIVILKSGGTGSDATIRFRERLETAAGDGNQVADSPPVFEATIVPAVGDNLLKQPFVAFCGIGRPQKFFDTLSKAGVTVLKTRSFPDHHAYTQAEALSLLSEARQSKAGLVTTEKDHVRLKGKTGALGELFQAAAALPIAVQFIGTDEASLMNMIAKALRLSAALNRPVSG